MSLLHFQQSGPSSSSQLPLVLIHGLFGSMDNLKMVERTLAKQYQVILVDVRNHGGSFHQNNMSYSVLADDVLAVLDHLNITKANILGHSMGGKVAMQIALDHSERINKLVVADIAPVAYPAHHQTIIKGLQAIDLNQVHNRNQADIQLAEYVEDKGVRQFLLRNLSKNEQGQYHFRCALDYIAQCYPQIMKGYQGNGQFNGDTLFIKGGQSDYIKAEHQPIIQQLFPHSSAKIIANAGHWLHAEKTVAFNKIVSDFLAS